MPAVTGELIETAVPALTLALSAGQESLWLIQQLLPESTAYHIAMAVRILAPVDQPALESALQTIVDRHESLRTVFVVDETGILGQCISSHAPVSFEVIDVSNLADEEVEWRVTSAFRAPFDLTAGPLFRAHFFTDRSARQVLLIAAHHLVFDALSLLTVFTELLELYASGREGREHKLLPVVAEYRDFVTWQAKTAAGPEGAAHLAFWRAELESAPTVLDLPTDHPRPLRASGEGSSLWFPVGEDLMDRLRLLAAGLEVNSVDIFAAAWHILLHRYSGQDDLLTGFVTGGRPGLRYARTTGAFSNTIVLRAQPDRDATIADFLRRQHCRLAECLKHQDYPFVRVVEGCAVERLPGHMPLVQVLFNYFMSRSSGISELLVTGHRAARVESEAFPMESWGLKQEGIEFDLMLDVADGKHCWMRIRFDSDIFEESTIHRLSRWYVRVLQSMAENAGQKISAIDLTPEYALHRPVRKPSDATALSLVESQCAASPARTAVIGETGRVTYGELDRAAASIAAYLRQRGVRKGDLVGVSLPRSAYLPAALLAVWKAGGAYVPLDPDFPRARLDLILEDAEPGFVLDAAEFPRALAAEPAEFSESAAGSDLAYVLYTSGSTGKPKGVEISHDALANFLLSMRRTPGICRDDVLLAVTTFAFDIAALELFLPLSTGAAVIVATRETVRDGKRLASEIERHGVTLMQATPASWRLLIDSGWSGAQRLKALCGGEAWTAQLAEQLLPRVDSLWNMYGPTETTVWSTVHRVGPADNPIPIGSPIDNTELYILDSNMHPVPRGAAGELHIGGAGLARGYRNLPELTCARFVTNPFAAGERLYKTGDLCRESADGSIHFLGRLDEQIKLHGHRIEPGEIETALMRHPTVSQAAVVLGDKRLIAWLVPASGSTLPPDGVLREYLAQLFPEYMVPSAFGHLQELPETPNGKTDRAALRLLDAPATRAEREYIAPRTPTEILVATLWEEILKTPRVGVNDRFDELGGDSLSFALMTLKAGKKLGASIPVRIDARTLTVAGLAREADRVSAPPQPTPRDVPEAARFAEPRRDTWFGRTLVRLCAAVVRCLISAEGDGVENLPAHGPAIFAANHVSLFDMAILGSVISQLPRGLVPMPTFIIEERWRWLAHPYASRFGDVIYIRRGEADARAIEAARHVLASGGVVAITPEGRATRGALARARSGAGYLASGSGARVWPLAIFGHDRAFEYWKRFRRVPVRVRLGKSIAIPPDSSRNADFQSHSDCIMEAIAALMPPEYHGPYAAIMK